MRQSHDDVRTLRAQPRQPGAGRVQDVACVDTPTGSVSVPFGDLWRRKADHAHPQDMGTTLGVKDLPPQDGEGRDQRFIPGGAGSKPRRDVRRYEGKTGFDQHLGQKAQAVVEFVVPQRRRVIAQRIEGGDHRMRAAAAGVGCEIGQGTALQEIAVVEQKAVLRFAAGLGDLLRYRPKAQIRIRSIGAIVIGHQAGMEVTGGDQSKRCGRPVRKSGQRRVWVPVLGLGGL